MRSVTPLILILLIDVPFVLPAEPGPLISDIRVDPSSGPSGTVYTISVRIVRPKDPRDLVPVLRQLRDGAESIDVPIHDDGMDGDALKGDGIYTGRSLVPSTAVRRTHNFEVLVEDKTGRRSNVLKYSFTVLGKKRLKPQSV